MLCPHTTPLFFLFELGGSPEKKATSNFGVPNCRKRALTLACRLPASLCFICPQTRTATRVRLYSHSVGAQKVLQQTDASFGETEVTNVS